MFDGNFVGRGTLVHTKMCEVVVVGFQTDPPLGLEGSGIHLLNRLGLGCWGIALDMMIRDQGCTAVVQDRMTRHKRTIRETD